MFRASLAMRGPIDGLHGPMPLGREREGSKENPVLLGQTTGGAIYLMGQTKWTAWTSLSGSKSQILLWTWCLRCL